MTDKKNKAKPEPDAVEPDAVELSIADSYPEHDLEAAEVVRSVIRGDGVLLLTIAAPRK